MVVSAGIPELDEAVALIESLQADGLPYVSFKPGTVDQIRQVVRIAKAVSPTTIMVQVEGGEAGGHHSWEALDDLLAATYAEVRACDNLVLVAGGGIGTPERAADYISGQWAHAYGLPDMPVDGVLIGTAAMTAKELTPARSQAAARQDARYSGRRQVRRRVRPAGRPLGAVRQVRRWHVLRPEPPARRHLRARERLRRMRPSARARHEAPRRARLPPQGNHRSLNKTAKPYFGDLAP